MYLLYSLPSAFLAGRLQTSGLAIFGQKPMSCKVSASGAQKAAPEFFSPYNAFLTNIMLPSYPNSGHAYIQIFSQQSAVRYAFCMSRNITCKSFKAATVRAIQTESCDTTDEYIRVAGGLGHVIPCHQPCLAAKVFSKFDVENHVTFHELVIN